jgi:hypothetical protein
VASTPGDLPPSSEYDPGRAQSPAEKRRQLEKTMKTLKVGESTH